ncbi:MAG TPA: OmpH family outer membrane protein [Candidatus Binatia bacterium]|nr:OmpH family outer membrane protein [Candidatus Binatia bacterium]
MRWSRGPLAGLASVLVGFLLGVWWVTPGVWAQAGAGSKIAFVDVQRVLARSAGGAAAREQMERERGTMQKQVDGHRVELEKLKDDLEKKGQLLSADARKEKQEALERKVRDVRRLVDDLQKELQKKEQELLGRVLRDLDGVIQKVGKEKGYLLIVERKQGGIVYGAPEADLTDEIIKMYDDDAQKAKR